MTIILLCSLSSIYNASNIVIKNVSERITHSYEEYSYPHSPQGHYHRGTMLVPGVSGGSMAMILGIYDRLITSVSSFTRRKKENLAFLIIFSLSGILGILLFASPLLRLIERYPMPMLYFFLGAVAGGIPLIIKQSGVQKVSWRSALYLILGLMTVSLFALIPSSGSQSEMTAGPAGFFLLMAAGFIAAAALVLPGISVSYLLLLMGIYDEMMRAVSEFYLPFLLPLGAGLILGIVLITKALEYALTRRPHPTYFIILGFIIGSMAEIFPGIPSGSELLLCALTLTAGFLAIWSLSRIEMKKSAA